MCTVQGRDQRDSADPVRTDSSGSTFAKSRANFERRGLKLGPITGLGDQAYYFSEQAGKSSVTTVAVQKGSLQLLVTGPATLDQIGSITLLHVEPVRDDALPAPSSG